MKEASRLQAGTAKAWRLQTDAEGLSGSGWDRGDACRLHAGWGGGNSTASGCGVRIRCNSRWPDPATRYRGLRDLGGVGLGLRELDGTRLGWRELGGSGMRWREHGVSRVRLTKLNCSRLRDGELGTTPGIYEGCSAAVQAEILGARRLQAEI